MTDFPTPRKPFAEFLFGRRRSSGPSHSVGETDSRFVRDTRAYKERYRRWQTMLRMRERAENPRPPMPEPTPAERHERMLRLMERAPLLRPGQKDEKDDESDYWNDFDRPTHEWTIMIPRNIPDHLQFNIWADPDAPSAPHEDAKRQQPERKRDEA